MEETFGSKRRRVYSFDPNTIIYTAFSQKYLSFLLPALLRSANGHKITQIEKFVRFEVDMALVLSTGNFKWSRALKHELEEGKKTNNLHVSLKCRSKFELNSHFCILKRFEHLQTFSAIPRPIVLVEAKRPGKASQGIMGRRTAGEEEELACRIRTLRRILPGGAEMDVHELLSEVESYVICLQLQVGVLRSLVDAQ